MPVPFVQRIGAHKRRIDIACQAEIEKMARELTLRGYAFTLDVWLNGDIFMCCSTPADEVLVSVECIGGRGVVEAVDRLIMTAYIRVNRGRAPAQPPPPFEAA